MTEIHEHLNDEPENVEEEEEGYMPNDVWITTRKDLLKRLKDFKKLKDPDRLASLTRIIEAHSMMMESFSGWETWLKSVHVMSNFSEKDLKDLTAEYIDVAIKYLELDVKATELIESLRDKTHDHISSRKEIKPQYAV